MKTLVIVRHAKSSWADMSLDDHDRPLNGRGHHDAPEMGRRMKQRGIIPDLMISSTARRAHDTCSYMAGILGYPERSIELNSRLFHASPSEIRNVVRQVSDKVNTLYIFGHNPGITWFANQLNHTDIDNVPTAGIVVSELKITSWHKIDAETGSELLFDYPKRITG